MKQIYFVTSIRVTSSEDRDIISESNFVIGAYEDKNSAINRAKKYGEYLIKTYHLRTDDSMRRSLNDFDDLNVYDCIILGKRDSMNEDGEYICTVEHSIEIEEITLFENGEGI